MATKAKPDARPKVTNPITMLLHAEGLTIQDLARILETSHGGANKFVAGERRINATHKRCLIVELGEVGEQVADLLEERYAAMRPEKVERLVLFDDTPTPLAECDYYMRSDGRVVYMEPDDPTAPIELYTIGEWKKRFGEPGMASDQHGRMMGFFATEPDFCE
jgi:hypothetical protein